MANARMMRQSRGVKLLMGAIIAVALTTGCSSSSDSGTGSGGSCAYTLKYKARDYGEVVNVDFAVGPRVGTAHPYPCNDSEGQAKGPSVDPQDDLSGQEASADPNSREEVAVYEIEGLAPKVAIAIKGTDGEPRLFAVQPHGKLPPEVRKLTKGSKGS